MKRVGYLYKEICDLDNCKAAILTASKGKRNRKNVKRILDNLDDRAKDLQKMLMEHSYKPSPYTIRYINDGIRQKRRRLAKPRFWPDQCVHHALERYEKHLKEKGPELKIGNDQELADYLEKKMAEEDYSPAAAVAMAKKEKVGGVTLSAPTVYSYIRKGVFLNLEMKDLPRHDKHGNSRKHVEKKKASRAPAGESIEQRPKEVNDRSEFGHWEGDTVYSGKNKSRKAILTITERQTRKEIIIQIPNRKAETVVKALDAIERQWGAPNFRTVFRSITVDNGTEFADASGMEKSCINKTIPRTKVYYAHPYSSWERGTNENQNGMIRRKHPKGTNFAEVSKAELTETEEWMNNYPRKVLGYRSSNQLFNERLAELGIKAA